MRQFLPLVLLLFTFHTVSAQQNIATFPEITATQAIGDRVYFSARHNTYGLELFVSNGTDENPVLVRDIHPGYIGSSPRELTVFNNQLFFVAFSPENVWSVWKTDGTAEGTERIFHVPNSEPHGLTVFKGRLYFTTSLGSLIQSDGTAAGTRVHFQAAYTYGRIQVLVKDEHYLYYTEDLRTFYRDNGSARISFLGQLSWEDVYFRGFYSLGDKLVVIKSSTYDHKIRFYAIDSNVIQNNGEDEWTVIKKLDAPLYGSQYIGNITVIDQRIFMNFRTYYDNVPPSDELWICDGTGGGTRMVKSFSWSPHIAQSHMGMFFSFKEQLYFRGGGALWTSDGTTQGTIKIHDASIIPPYNDNTLPLLVSDDKFYFSGGDEYHAELWESDGTTENTRQLLDINDAGSSWPHNMCFANGILYFVTSQQYSSTLWSSSPAADISVWINGTTPVMSGSTPLVFYEVSKGACRTMDLTIRNKGLSTLYLRSLYISGRDFYLVRQTLPEELAPGQSADIRIIFNAVREGASEGTLTILSNDRDEPRYVISFQGNSKLPTATPICEFFQADFVRTLSADKGEAAAFALSNNSINEGLPIGSVVGEFSSASEATFGLVEGGGDDDNAKFYIAGNQLRSNVIFSYDKRTVYTIRVRATTAGGETESVFRIDVNNASTQLASGECGKVFQQMGFSFSALESNMAGHLFVTTAAGQIIRSIDAGKTWHIVYSGDYIHQSTIAFKGNTGFIAVTNALLKSDDGGATWFRVYFPGKKDGETSAISFLNDKEGYVGSASGQLLFTADGGRTWEVRLQDNYTNFRLLHFIDQKKGYAIVGYGNLSQTLDGGRTWAPVSVAGMGWNTQAVNIFFVSDKKGFLVMTDNLYKTTDGGISWTIVQSVGSVYTAHIRFISATVGFLYGNFGVVYRTIDGGDTWEPNYYTASLGHIVGMGQASGQLFLASTSAYSYETGRAMAVSADEGLNWSSVYQYGEGFISRIQFLTDSEGAILSPDGILHTEDGGISWRPMITDIANVSDLLMLDDGISIMVSSGNIYKSQDGGLTNRLVLNTTATEGQPAAGKLYRAPGNILFSIAWGALYRSDDLGETWTLYSSPTGFYTQTIHFISSSTGYRMDWFGSVEKTADGGKTWTEIFTHDPTSSSVFHSLYYLNDRVGFKGGDFLQRTTDGGDTWETLYWDFYDLIAINFDSEDHGYLVSRAGRVYETSDGGKTWGTIFYNSSTVGNVQFRDGSIFLAGQNGFSARMTTTPRTPSIPGYIYGEGQICAGDAMDFYVAPNNDYLTQWSTTGGNLEDQSGYITVRFPEPGEYTITAAFFNSCGVGDTRSRTVIVSGSQAGPVIAGPTTASVGQQGIAYAVADPAENASYLWSVVGGTLASSNNDFILVDWSSEITDGKVNVLEIQASGCRAYGSLSIGFQPPLSVEDPLEEQVSLYPNPSEARAIISSSYNGSLVVRVIDLTGREYSRYNLASGDSQPLDLVTLTPGLYMIEISNGDHSVTKKLIKK